MNEYGVPIASFFPAADENNKNSFYTLSVWLVNCWLYEYVNATFCDMFHNVLAKFFGPPKKNFIILTSPRSGSTLLVDQLNRHPQVLCMGEVYCPNTSINTNIHFFSTKHKILNPRYVVYGNFMDPKSSEQRVALHCRSCFSKPFSVRCIGAKIFLEHLRWYDWSLFSLLETLKKPKVLYLYRSNLLESYLSLHIAFHNNRWYSTSLVNTEECVILDLQDFKEYQKSEIHYHRSAWNALKLKYRENILLVEYEDLLPSNRDQSMERIFRFIEAGDKTSAKGFGRSSAFPPSVKQNPGTLRDKIYNYDELDMDRWLENEDNYRLILR